MSPLVRGQYHEYNPFQALTGNLVNVTQPNLPAFSNTDWFGFSPADSTAGTVTAAANAVAVPVDWGITFTKATVICGAAGGTITHANAQLYSGLAVPAALGTQSTDATSTPFTVGTSTTFTFAPVTATSVNAPGKFLYFSLGLTASVQASLASVSTPVALNANPSVFGAAAPVFAARYTGGGAAAPATLVAGTTVAAAFLVWLT